MHHMHGLKVGRLACCLMGHMYFSLKCGVTDIMHAGMHARVCMVGLFACLAATDVLMLHSFFHLGNDLGATHCWPEVRSLLRHRRTCRHMKA